MTFKRRLASMILPLSLLSGCAMLPADNDVYELHREAQTAYTSEQDQRAEKLLQGLARAAPNDPETWFQLGNLYARTNQPEQATQAYQKSLMLKSIDPRAWHNLGVVRLREAWAAFIQAHHLAPLDDPLYTKLENLISAMEKIPLDGLSRQEKSVTATPVVKTLPAEGEQQ